MMLMLMLRDVLTIVGAVVVLMMRGPSSHWQSGCEGTKTSAAAIGTLRLVVTSRQMMIAAMDSVAAASHMVGIAFTRIMCPLRCLMGMERLLRCN